MEKYVDNIFLGFEDAGKFFKQPEKHVVAGNPVRKSFFTLSKKEAREKLGIPQDDFVVFTFGGSLGAAKINDVAIELLELFNGHSGVTMVMGTGKLYKDEIAANIAASIDALAVGISFAFLKVDIGSAVLTIGVITLPGIDILLVGYDRELNYGKLEDACFLLKQGVDYFATNPDWVCPTEWGFVPDCGAICQMLEHASKRKPHFIGKPKPDIALMALEQAGVSKEETLLVGDRLYTDIACGFNAEIDTCFVLSGEGTLEDMEKSSVKPTYVMKDIKELLRRIKYET